MRRRRFAVPAGGLALLALGLISVAPAWWDTGHVTLTEAAAARLPDDVPAFFRGGGKVLAHCAVDPDRWKNRGTPYSRAAEEPNHFLDLEYLEGKPFPDDRFKGIELMQELKRKPNRVGLLPYAILENVDKLTGAFYDYRQDDKHPAIPMKCLVYGGNLAHYSTDAAMPLHCTRDYDGRKDDKGNFVQKGIHARLDSFPGKFRLTAEEIGRGLKPREVENLLKYVQEFVVESHGHVEKCYAFDAAGAFEKPTDESRAFVLKRCQAGAQFTIDLWYTAWKRSAKLSKHW